VGPRASVLHIYETFPTIFYLYVFNEIRWNICIICPSAIYVLLYGRILKFLFLERQCNIRQSKDIHTKNASRSVLFTFLP
jgi:hypothetical protein